MACSSLSVEYRGTCIPNLTGETKNAITRRGGRFILLFRSWKSMVLDTDGRVGQEIWRGCNWFGELLDSFTRTFGWV